MRRQLLSPVALLLAAGGSLMAQEMVGTITGTVKTPEGTPIQGAVIRVSSPKLLGERTASTDAQGTFRLPLLLPGDYKGNVTKDGYIGSKAEFRVTAGGVVRQDFTMRVMQTGSAIVEVIAASSAVDKTQTKTASVQTFDDIQTIPVTGNYAIKALAALALSPSVNDSNPYYATVRGGAQGQTQYMVNGLSVRDNITSQGRPHDVILDDLVEESQVILSPLNAKYGDSSAGLVNIVEKTGSNDFSGTFRVKLDRGSWNTQRPRGWTINGQPYGSAEGAPSDDLTRVYEVSVTGPIIKDKLTFTYGTRSQPVSTLARQAVDLGARTYALWNGAARPAYLYDNAATQYLPQLFTFHQGRLFWQISADHTLDYSHSENFNQYADWGSTGNTVGIDLAIGGKQTSVNTFRQLTYRGIFFGNNTLEVRYGKRKSTITFVSGPGDPITVRFGPSTMTSLLTGTTAPTTNGGNADNQPERRNTDSLIANWSSFFDAAGTHNLDIGFNWTKTIWGSVQNSGGMNQRVFRTAGRLANGSFVMFNYSDLVNGVNYNLNATNRAFIPTMTQYMGSSQGELTKPTTSFYVNDQWAFNNNWSLMYGVRHEIYKYNDAQGERYSSSSTSPRLELKWDVNGNNQRIFNLSYGEFRGNVHERITRSFSTFRYTTVVTRFWNQGAGQGAYEVPYAQVINPANYGYVYDYQVPNAVFAIDKGFKPDVSKEVVFGYRRSYTNGASIVANLVYRKWADLPISVGDPALINVADPTGSGLPSKTNYLRTLKNDPNGKREYKAFELEFKTPIIPSTLYLNGTYTFSRTTGNSQMQDATTLQQAAIEAGTFYPYLKAQGVPESLFNPVGQLGTSANNVLRVMLMYTATVGAVKSTVTFLGRYNDGAVENRTTNSVSNPSSFNPLVSQLPSSYVAFWAGRGQYRQADFTSFDLAYNLEIPIKKKVAFFATLACVNVFNTIRPGVYNWDNDGTAQATPLGYRTDPSYANVYGGVWNYASFNGGRDFNLDIGLRF